MTTRVGDRSSKPDESGWLEFGSRDKRGSGARAGPRALLGVLGAPTKCARTGSGLLRRLSGPLGGAMLLLTNLSLAGAFTCGCVLLGELGAAVERLGRSVQQQGPALLTRRGPFLVVRSARHIASSAPSCARALGYRSRSVGLQPRLGEGFSERSSRPDRRHHN